MNPTLKQLKNMIEEIKLKLKSQGTMTDARLEQHLDLLNQLYISRIIGKR